MGVSVQLVRTGPGLAGNPPRQPPIWARGLGTMSGPARYPSRRLPDVTVRGGRGLGGPTGLPALFFLQLPVTLQ